MKKVVYVAVTLFFALLQVCGAGAGAGDYVVRGAEAKGGTVSYFLNGLDGFKEKKIRVVLKGTCTSACTLYTALLRDKLLCAKPGTKLVFHQFFYPKNANVDAAGVLHSTDVGHYVSGFERMNLWFTYPPSVRRIIFKHSPSGLPEVGNELVFSAKELNIPPC